LRNIRCSARAATGAAPASGRLERHTDVEIETPRACIVEVVVADIRQTDVIAQSEIEHVEARATSDAQTAIEALESCIVIVEARISLTGTIVLDLSTDTKCQIATGKRLNGDIGRNRVLIFDHKRQLQVFKPVCELIALIGTFATFLRIGETGLKIERCSRRQTCADDSAEVKTCTRVTAVKDSCIGTYSGYIQTQAEAIVGVTAEVAV
jgi:hypothetical protein